MNNVSESYTHVYQVGFQQLWVRDAIIAFTAFAFFTRDRSLRALTYKSYQLATREVCSNIMQPGYAENAEDLLIVTLFLGLMEVSDFETERSVS